MCRQCYVDIKQPQSLIEAWGKNAAYHFVFTRQNRGKLDALTNLAGERGLVKPVIGAVLPLTRIGEAHDLWRTEALADSAQAQGWIDVAGENRLPSLPSAELFPY